MVNFVLQVLALTECSVEYGFAICNYIMKTVYYVSAAAAAAKSLQSCPTLCDSIDSSPPGSPIPGILQARTLEWVAISFSSACNALMLSRFSCPTLCGPMDRSSPGSSIHGILQVKTLDFLLHIIRKQ